jgi:hypothetical protein
MKLIARPLSSFVGSYLLLLLLHACGQRQEGAGGMASAQGTGGSAAVGTGETGGVSAGTGGSAPSGGQPGSGGSTPAALGGAGPATGGSGDATAGAAGSPSTPRPTGGAAGAGGFWSELVEVCYQDCLVRQQVDCPVAPKTCERRCQEDIPEQCLFSYRELLRCMSVAGPSAYICIEGRLGFALSTDFPCLEQHIRFVSCPGLQ